MIMQVPQDFTTLVSIVTGISAIIALVKVLNAPVDKIKQHDNDIKEIKAEQTRRKEIDKAILNSLQAMTNHMIDGNGRDKLQASRDELQREISNIING